jgi:hypothetical protein
VIDFVMVTPPKPPGSSTLISPPVAVFDRTRERCTRGAAAAGWRRRPPETHVRVACALASPRTPGEQHCGTHDDSAMTLRTQDLLPDARLERCRILFTVPVFTQGGIDWFHKQWG